MNETRTIDIKKNLELVLGKIAHWRGYYQDNPSQAPGYLRSDLANIESILKMVTAYVENES